MEIIDDLVPRSSGSERRTYSISFPPFIKDEPTDPSVERPSMNVIHLEPIPAKFERQLHVAY
jgi:hypothetical protein